MKNKILDIIITKKMTINYRKKNKKNKKQNYKFKKKKEIIKYKLILLAEQENPNNKLI